MYELAWYMFIFEKWESGKKNLIEGVGDEDLQNGLKIKLSDED